MKIADTNFRAAFRRTVVRLLFSVLFVSALTAVAASSAVWNDLAPYPAAGESTDFWDTTGHGAFEIVSATSGSVSGADVIDVRTFGVGVSNVLPDFKTTKWSGILLIIR